MKRKLLVCLMVTTIGTSIITGCGKENKSDTSDTKSTKTESMKEDVAKEDSTDDSKTQDMTDYSEIEWPDNTATKMIPKPKSIVGKITFESEDSLMADIANTSDEDYDSYVEKCKKRGYTEDYTMMDDDSSKTYGAKNKNGYEILLSLDDNVMSVLITPMKDSDDATTD